MFDGLILEHTVVAQTQKAGEAEQVGIVSRSGVLNPKDTENLDTRYGIRDARCGIADNR